MSVGSDVKCASEIELQVPYFNGFNFIDDFRVELHSGKAGFCYDCRNHNAENKKKHFPLADICLLLLFASYLISSTKLLSKDCVTSYCFALG